MSIPPSPELLDRVATALGPFHHEGDTVLVYRGEADEVTLRTWMPNFPVPAPFTSVSRELHFLRLPLPATARIEYKIVIRHGRVAAEVADPLNPPSASNPFGTNSVATGPDYRPPWYEEGTSLGEGDLHEIRVNSPALGGRHHHRVYLPAGVVRKAVHTLLLVHDGIDFLEHAGLGRALDRLIEKDVIPPLAAVLLQPRERIMEYGASPGHSLHLAAEVIPHLARRMRVWAPPERTVAMGSSLGGVAALAALVHHPEVFGSVISLSGSFAHRTDDVWPATVFTQVIAFLESFNPTLLAGIRMYQSVGRYEGLVDFNRRLHAQLQAAGMKMKWVETWTGHDWGAWRDRFEDALTWVFPLV